MSIERRTFLKGSAATGALALALGTGLLTPKTVLAAWPEKAFQQKTVDEALKSLFDTTSPKAGAIDIKAPEIAENGAVVPITISTKMSNVETIAVIVSKNPQPLSCSYDFRGAVEPTLGMRIKMGETSDIIAVVKSSDGVFSASKTVKVTIGGCGG